MATLLKSAPLTKATSMTSWNVYACIYACFSTHSTVYCTQILMEEAVISCLFKNYRGHSIVVSLACLSTQTAFRTVCDPVHWWQLTEDGNVFWFSHTVPPENSWQDPWISSRHWHIVYRKNNFFSLSEPFQNSDGFNLFLAYYFWWQKEKHCKNQCNTTNDISTVYSTTS